MAKLGENRYYQRSGDGFHPMDHFDVQDVFGRRRRPHLDLYVRSIGSGRSTELFPGISTSRRGAAVAPYLAFSIPKPFLLNEYGIEGNRNERLPRLIGRVTEEWRRRIRP